MPNVGVKVRRNKEENHDRKKIAGKTIRKRMKREESGVRGQALRINAYVANTADIDQKAQTEEPV